MEEKQTEISEKKPKEKKKLKKFLLIILAVLLALILAFVGTFFVLNMLGRHQFEKNDKDIIVTSEIEDIVEVDDENVVYYNDKEYVLNEDVVSILLMGIDKKSINEAKKQGLNGQADTIVVAAIDLSDKSIDMIPIPRETMTDVSIYNQKGEFIEIKKEQICLSYAYGNSGESSGKNVMTSVSRLLYGIAIDSYVSLDLDGVGVLTDAVGGVELNSLETLKRGSYDIKQGERLNLKGELAKFYIQDRASDKEASMRRLQRQKQFMSAFASKAGNIVLSDFSKLASLYSAATPYINTDLSLAQLTYLATNVLRADIGSHINYLTVAGEINMGEKWVEFNPDNEKLLATVIDVFYKEK